jgi:hypothetical protein
MAAKKPAVRAATPKPPASPKSAPTPGIEHEATASSSPVVVKHYVVLADGIAGVDGIAYFKWKVVAAADIGDAARVKKLLAKGAIKEAP